MDPDTFINITKQLSTNLGSYIFTSGAIIYLATYFFYKSNVKWKHKQLKLSDDVSKLLRFFAMIELIVPISLAVILAILSNSEDIMVLLFVILSMIVLGIAMIYLYIIISATNYRINIVTGRWNKIKRFISRYFLVVLLIIMVTFFNILTIVGIISIIDDIENSLQSIKYIVVIYSFSPFIIFCIYAVHTEGMIKGISHVKIFYTQGQYINKDRHVKFEDFDIDKDYLSYLDSKKVRTVVPTKDLLRIEYVYKDN